MTLSPAFNRRIRIVFHSLGLSCIGGAIFLQILVFADILQHGYFMAVEQNPTILAFELALTAFSVIYFLHSCQKLMRQVQ
jgi:hypothetical protein